MLLAEQKHISRDSPCRTWRRAVARAGFIIPLVVSASLELVKSWPSEVGTTQIPIQVSAAAAGDSSPGRSKFYWKEAGIDHLKSLNLEGQFHAVKDHEVAEQNITALEKYGVTKEMLVFDNSMTDEKPAEAPMIHVDKVKDFFKNIYAFFKATVGRMVHHDVALLVASAMILQFHLRHNFARWSSHPKKWVRQLGVDIFILQIYYDDSLPTFVSERRFTFTLFFVLLDQVFLNRVFRQLAKMVDDKKKPGRQSSSYEERLTVNLGEIKCGNIYENIVNPFAAFVVPMFIVQVGLCGLWADHLNSDDDTKSEKKVNYAYWVLAILMQLYACEHSLGADFSPAYWQKLHRHAGDFAEEVVMIQRSYWWKLREFFDMTVNGGIRGLMLFTFPILLCVEAPLDFIRDCMVVWFISTLDDIKDDTEGNAVAATIDEMIEVLRKREHPDAISNS